MVKMEKDLICGICLDSIVAGSFGPQLHCQHMFRGRKMSEVGGVGWCGGVGAVQ